MLGLRRERPRQRNVAAATARLLELGYSQMRGDEVATAAKVTRPALCGYFVSTRHLLLAAMSEEAMQPLAAAEPLLDPVRPAEERLCDFVREAMHYMDRAPLTARIVRDRDPGVLRLTVEHELAVRTAQGMDAQLDKAMR